MKTDLRQQLIDDTVTDTSPTAGGSTLLEDSVQLIEDDDMETTFILLLFILVGDIR